MHVEFYIMSWDPTTEDFFEALAEVAARGVKVRLLFDHIGTARIPGYRDMIKKLKQTADRVAPDAADPAAERQMATA